MGKWIPEFKKLLGSNDTETDENPCLIIHKLFNKLPRYYYNNISQLPFNNGIYIMFEKGEKYLDMDRIVRVGTHRADDRLKDRLKDHFLKKNVDGSIFRKNIGRALLHKVNDPYEAVWELDTSKPSNREKYADSIDIHYKSEIENSVTDYLQNNISFVCFQVNTESERLRFEEGLISLLNNSEDFKSSNMWLGLSSPKNEIVNSRLWNVQGLTGKPLMKNEIRRIGELTQGKSINSDSSIINTTINKSETNSYLKENILHDTNEKVSTDQICDFIQDILVAAKENGQAYLDIISGDIHKAMNLNKKMPSVCNVMYKLKKENDELLNTTPSGKSSTIRIRYYL